MILGILRKGVSYGFGCRDSVNEWIVDEEAGGENQNRK